MKDPSNYLGPAITQFLILLYFFQRKEQISGKKECKKLKQHYTMTIRETVNKTTLNSPNKAHSANNNIKIK